MTVKFAVLTSVVVAGVTALAGVASADTSELTCTTAEKSSWMSEDATKNLLVQQGYKEVREIKATEGNCYEVYAVDANGQKVEIYLDPTNGKLVAKED